MKNKSFSFFCLFISVFIFSCSTNENQGTKKDSVAVNKPDSLKKIVPIEIQTDSGRLEIQKENGRATLINGEGKILQKGFLENNLPVGAWVKYNASGKAIHAEQFSKGKPLLQLDANDFNFRQWKNEKLGLAFSVPENWKEVPTGDTSQIDSFLKSSVKVKSNQVTPGFFVDHRKLSPGENLDFLQKNEANLMHGNYDRVDIIEEGEISVDSCAAFRRYGMYGSDEENTGFLKVIIIKGDEVWHFTCTAPNENSGFLKYQGVFEEILESIHIVY
jgi:hypothetical protein